MNTLTFEITNQINKEQDIMDELNKEIGFSSQSSEHYCQGKINGLTFVLGLLEERNMK